MRYFEVIQLPIHDKFLVLVSNIFRRSDIRVTLRHCSLCIRYDTIEKFNVDSKAEYTKINYRQRSVSKRDKLLLSKLLFN